MLMYHQVFVFYFSVEYLFCAWALIQIYKYIYKILLNGTVFCTDFTITNWDSSQSSLRPDLHHGLTSQLPRQPNHV